MKVKLKSEDALRKQGFEVIDEDSDEVPVRAGHLLVLKNQSGSPSIALPIAKNRKHCLTVVDNDTLTLETFLVFRDAFEVIEE